MNRGHMDPYLETLFAEAEAEDEVVRGAFDVLETVAKTAAAPLMMPALLRVRPGWEPPQLGGLEVLSRAGTVVAVRGTKGALEKLRRDKGVLSIEASRDGGTSDAQPAAAPGVPVARPNTAERGDACVIGVIDSGFDVLHETFRAAGGTTRIAALWDQRDQTGPTPFAVDPALYPTHATGTLHTRAQIDGYIAAGAVPKGLGRDADSGHGTHVASIAAGRAVGQVADGLAPDATLVLVVAKAADASGNTVSLGYSVAHHAALTFVTATADQLGLPVVINVSQGMNAGAHDGSSALEAGFEEITGSGRTPGVVIVKSAGNAKTDASRAFALPLDQGTVTIDWDSSGAKRPRDYIEAWYHPADDLVFRLFAPNGNASDPVDAAAPSWNGQLQGNSCQLTLTRHHVDNGDAQLVIMILGQPKSGTWRLEIEGRSFKSGRGVDAWVERRKVQDNFDFDVAFKTGLQTDATLSIPATAHALITVGAYAPPNATPVPQSSSGKTRDERQKPDCAAPGANVLAAESDTSDGAVAMTGTSMAAPFVTGLVALGMSARSKANKTLLNAHQVRAVLAATCSGFKGHWHPQLGFGRVDPIAALALL